MSVGSLICPPCVLRVCLVVRRLVPYPAWLAVRRGCRQHASHGEERFRFLVVAESQEEQAGGDQFGERPRQTASGSAPASRPACRQRRATISSACCGSPPARSPIQPCTPRTHGSAEALQQQGLARHVVPDQPGIRVTARQLQGGQLPLEGGEPVGPRRDRHLEDGRRAVARHRLGGVGGITALQPGGKRASSGRPGQGCPRRASRRATACGRRRSRPP